MFHSLSDKLIRFIFNLLLIKVDIRLPNNTIKVYMRQPISIAGSSNGTRRRSGRAIDEYIEFYNFRRLQKKLNSQSPMEYRSLAA
ncbi:MAG: IS3 family transposase [Syntrophomonas sp.]|nr:IS3 family transposase [Syntrophomonas sp.]